MVADGQSAISSSAFVTAVAVRERKETLVPTPLGLTLPTNVARLSSGAGRLVILQFVATVAADARLNRQPVTLLLMPQESVPLAEIVYMA